jgi:hypothetical protein
MALKNRRDPDRGKEGGTSVTPTHSLAVWPILVAWLLAVAWLLSPSASTAGGRWQYVVWIPDWVWLALVGFCSVLALTIVTMGRRPRSRGLALAAGLALIGPLWGTLHRDVGLPSRASLGDATVLFLNSQDPGSRVVDAMVDQLVAMDADVAVIVNPGWIPITWRAVESAHPTGRFLRRVGRFFVVSRTAIRSMRRIVAKGEIQAMEITLETEDGALLPRTIVVVDLPSDLAVHRSESLRNLAAGISTAFGSAEEARSRIDLLVGDLNTTPRTPELGLIIPGFNDVFTKVGRGWGGTWPRDRGWLRIDFALAPQDRVPASVETFDPGGGGHRGLVIRYRRP